jgi:excinuclease UvrABC helicase subunit UvrB
MNNAAKKLEFLEAAQLRDQLIMLEDKLAKKR